MSVCLFSKQEIQQLQQHIKYHWERAAEALSQNQHCLRYIKRYRATKSLEKAISDFIARVLHYAQVANRVAYLLQYQEIFSLETDVVYFDAIQPLACTPEVIYSTLCSLDRDLYTNDGNRFLEEKWYQPFCHLLHVFSGNSTPFVYKP